MENNKTNNRNKKSMNERDENRGRKEGNKDQPFTVCILKCG